MDLKKRRKADELAESAYIILSSLLMSPSLYRKAQIVQIQYLAGCYIFFSFCPLNTAPLSVNSMLFYTAMQQTATVYRVDSYVILNMNLIKMRRASFNSGGFTKLMAGLISH